MAAPAGARYIVTCMWAAANRSDPNMNNVPASRLTATAMRKVERDCESEFFIGGTAFDVMAWQTPGGPLRFSGYPTCVATQQYMRDVFDTAGEPRSPTRHIVGALARMNATPLLPQVLQPEPEHCQH